MRNLTSDPIFKASIQKRRTGESAFSLSPNLLERSLDGSPAGPIEAIESPSQAAVLEADSFGCFYFTLLLCAVICRSWLSDRAGGCIFGCGPWVKTNLGAFRGREGHPTAVLFKRLELGLAHRYLKSFQTI